MTAKQIEALRIKMDWTQEDAAKRLKVTQSAWSRWESGSAKPRVGHMKMLLEIKRKLK